MLNQSLRKWIVASLALQFCGYVFDVVWHGLLRPGVEPATTGEMLRHLSTIHLPLYIGALSVLASTVWAFLHERPRSTGLAVAVAGAVVSAGSEAWHALSHLQMDTHTAPVAGILSAVGFVVVVLAITLWGRRDRRATHTTRDRRAA
jgi:hypothetical protein